MNWIKIISLRNFRLHHKYNFSWNFYTHSNGHFLIIFLIDLKSRYFSGSWKVSRMNPKVFLLGHEPVSYFCWEETNVCLLLFAKQMVKSETRWRKKMPKSPSGEKSHLVKTRSWGCICALIQCLWCHASSINKSTQASHYPAQQGLPGLPLLSLLAARALLGAWFVTHGDGKLHVGTSLHKSASNTTRFLPTV